MQTSPSRRAVSSLLLVTLSTASASSLLPYPGAIGFSPYPLDHLNITFPLPCEGSTAIVVPTSTAPSWMTLLVMPTTTTTPPLTAPATTPAGSAIPITGGVLAGEAAVTTLATVSVMGRGASPVEDPGYIAMCVAFAAMGWGLVVA